MLNDLWLVPWGATENITQVAKWACIIGNISNVDTLLHIEQVLGNKQCCSNGCLKS